MKVRVCVTLLALLSSAFAGHAPALAAASVPDPAAIRAKIAAAEGALPEAYRELITETRSGGEAKREIRYTRGKDYRVVIDNGPFHTESGSYRGDDWHMNENGQVVAEQPDPGKATPDRTTTTVIAVHTPVEGYLIATLNARGSGLKEYVNGATWHVVRTERVTPSGTIVRTYDDVRADHGRTFAHHVHIEDGYARTSSDRRIEECVPDAVSEKNVAMPPPRRALVTFPAGTTQVELPTKFGEDHVYVRVMIGTRGLDFVLDTGASGITIDESVARELGLPTYGKHSEVTAGRHTSAMSIVPDMRIGPLQMRDVAVEVLPHGWRTAPDVKEVGLLGFDFLAELGVTIDYERQRVTVVPGELYKPPTDKYTIPLDVRIGDGTPNATVTLNGAVGERWTLDTGGSGTFMIFDYFARRHPEAMRDQGGGGIMREIEYYGIGGRIPTKPYQIASLRLANVNFTDFVGYRVTGNETYAEDEDGVIGVDFLHLFTLGLDYGNSRVYLVPNKLGRAAMKIK